MINREVGLNIRAYREALGMTQADLAERLSRWGWEVDNTAIAKIESGKRALRVGQLVMISWALGRSVHTLTEGDTGGSASPADAAAIRDAVGRLSEDLDAARSELEMALRMQAAADAQARHAADQVIVLRRAVDRLEHELLAATASLSEAERRA